jgi:hypothetical protein
MNLESALFLETPVEMYERVFRTLKPRTAPPKFAVDFCAFANANSFIKLEGERIHVRITDVLESAPAPIQEALAYILLSKLFRRQIPSEYRNRYRRFLHRKDVRSQLAEIRQERGRKHISAPSGVAYDLEAIFDEMNFRYFHGLMARPTIGWSRRASRTTLGHYDPSHNVIVLSRWLDKPEVPKLLVEYVMFHEMLHLRYPVEHQGARRCVHTADFRAAEKNFERLREAKALMKLL